MVAWLAGTLSQVAAFWLPTSHPAAAPSASGLMTVAAIALTAMIVAFLARGGQIAAVITARPLTGRAAALRRKSWSAAFQRQRNPDAAGRARPRAPSAPPAAA
jgi:Family of unknown function (DUF6412)